MSRLTSISVIRHSKPTLRCVYVFALKVLKQLNSTHLIISNVISCTKVLESDFKEVIFSLHSNSIFFVNFVILCDQYVSYMAVSILFAYK